MSARFKRDLARRVLAGASVQGRITELIIHGLVTLEAVIKNNDAAIRSAAQARGARSWWVRHRMKHGVVLELCVHPALLLVGKLRLRSKRVVEFRKSPVEKARAELTTMLEHRIGTDVDEALAVLRAIERARQRALELTEEGTRWLV